MTYDGPVKANPGGQLAPNEVFGRDALIEGLWRILERQSVVLIAERRMGKTQVIKKMQAESPFEKLPVYHDFEGVRSALEFVEIVFHDVERFLSRWQRTAERTRLVLSKLGGGEAAGLKFPEQVGPHWKALLTHTIEDLVEHQREKQVIFLWDELPLMIDNIRKAQGEPAAMELLDTLRALRQSHAALRMVYTGSVGLHHVLSALRTAGYVNPSTNDMKTVEVGPLEVGDAEHLAIELLKGEGVQAPDLSLAARVIAEEADNVPYYIHHIVDDLASRRQTASAEVIRAMVAGRLRDPQDSWELRHYFERIPRYYREGDSPLAYLILDSLAHSDQPLSLDALFQQVQARIKTNDAEPTRNLLRLLQRDHYVIQNSDNTFQFRLRLIRRGWTIQRPRSVS